MTYKITISERAENDLSEISFYISYILKSKENSISQMKRLKKAIKSLNEFPERYKKYKKDIRGIRNLRVMPVDNYLIFYIVDTEIKRVDVVRVLYSARDLDRFV